MVRPTLSGEWRRAQECLGAAALCRDNGFHADAISRAYYAIMHAAKAVLERYGVIADTHDAVNRLFGQRLVMAGSIEREWGPYLGRSLRLRNQADYDVTITFTETDSTQAVERASAFINRLQALLDGAPA